MISNSSSSSGSNSSSRSSSTSLSQLTWFKSRVTREFSSAGPTTTRPGEPANGRLALLLLLLLLLLLPAAEEGAGREQGGGVEGGSREEGGESREERATKAGGAGRRGRGRGRRSRGRRSREEIGGKGAIHRNLHTYVAASRNPCHPRKPYNNGHAWTNCPSRPPKTACCIYCQGSCPREPHINQYLANL